MIQDKSSSRRHRLELPSVTDRGINPPESRRQTLRVEIPNNLATSATGIKDGVKADSVVVCRRGTETEISCDMRPIRKKTTGRGGAPVVSVGLSRHPTVRITHCKNFLRFLLNFVSGRVNMNTDTSSSLGRGLSLVTAG